MFSLRCASCQDDEVICVNDIVCLLSLGFGVMYSTRGARGATYPSAEIWRGICGPLRIDSTQQQRQSIDRLGWVYMLGRDGLFGFSCVCAHVERSCFGDMFSHGWERFGWWWFEWLPAWMPKLTIGGVRKPLDEGCLPGAMR